MDTCCTDRKKQRTPEEKRALCNRLSRLEGQIRGLRNMVEQDAYCTDVLTQSAAAAAALKAFNLALLSDHIHTCVVQDLQNGKEDTAQELCEVLQMLMK